MGFEGKYKKTLDQFTRRAVAALGDTIEAIVVYGSVARGEARDDSDIDILILTREGSRIADQVLELNYDLDLENQTVSLHVYYIPEEFEQLLSVGSPFADDVISQGMVLYDSGTFQRLRAQVPGISR